MNDDEANSTKEALINMGVQPHWASMTAAILQKEINTPGYQRSDTEQRIVTTAWKQYSLRALHNPEVK
jgi:hypothetical protein